jgi:ribose transport system permease protein
MSSSSSIETSSWGGTGRSISAYLGKFSDLRLLAAIAVAMVVLSLSSDAFLTGKNLSSVGLYWAFVAMAALGQLFVVIVGGIDLSVGSTMGLAGIVTASIMAEGGNPIWAFVVGLLIGLAVGAFNGVVVAYIGITSFIVTLATLQMVRGITLGYKQGQAVSGLPEGFLELGTAPVLGVPIPIWIAVFLAVIVWIVLAKTALGRDMYAVGSNRVAAGLSGVPVKRRILLAFIFSGLFAGLAGVMVTARLGSAVPNAGVGMELTVIAAVVIGGASLAGGKGTALGVLLGALLISLVNNALVLLSVPTYWQQTFIGAVILVAAMFDLFRRRSRTQ